MNEVMTIENVTNLDKDHFNESLLTLLNGQHDLQKQSFNMMQDMTCRHEYDNLIGAFLKSWEKHGISRLAATN